METRTNTAPSKTPHALAWVAAIALIVLCGTGVAVLMGWIPAWTGSTGDKAGIVSSVIQLNA